MSFSSFDYWINRQTELPPNCGLHQTAEPCSNQKRRPWSVSDWTVVRIIPSVKALFWKVLAFVPMTGSYSSLLRKRKTTVGYRDQMKPGKPIKMPRLFRCFSRGETIRRPMFLMMTRRRFTAWSPLIHLCHCSLKPEPTDRTRCTRL